MAVSVVTLCWLSFYQFRTFQPSNFFMLPMSGVFLFNSPSIRVIFLFLALKFLCPTDPGLFTFFFHIPGFWKKQWSWVSVVVLLPKKKCILTPLRALSRPCLYLPRILSFGGFCSFNVTVYGGKFGKGIFPPGIPPNVFSFPRRNLT